MFFLSQNYCFLLSSVILSGTSKPTTRIGKKISNLYPKTISFLKRCTQIIRGITNVCTRIDAKVRSWVPEKLHFDEKDVPEKVYLAQKTHFV